MNASTTDDVDAARAWAAFYRDQRGYQPLPSCPTDKRPLIRYSQWWEERAPADLFDRHPTTNVQVMTGRFWGLLVIDLDGPEAVAHWPKLAPCCPRTWVTHSGGGGQHLWFTIPRNGPPLPKARLWGVWDATANDGKGGWEKRKNIERLCDRSLVMAPPSIHPKTGRRYRFLTGHSPREIARPAPCPWWVLQLPPLESPSRRIDPPSRLPSPRSVSISPCGLSLRAVDVLDAIHDKLALARSWGLRVASSRPNAAGWVPCHAIGREDTNPSASFSPSSGRYWEAGEGATGLFDLAVRLGVYRDWREAKSDLADRFVLGLRKKEEISSSPSSKACPSTHETNYGARNAHGYAGAHARSI